MVTATISQLKNSLGTYLKQVRAGERVMILDRRKPVAVLEPIRGDDQPDARLERLERAGIVRPSRHPDARAALNDLEPPLAHRSVLAALIAERRQAR